MSTQLDDILCTYFLNGAFLGQSTYPRWNTNGGRLRYLPNRALFCPACGDIWARLLFVPTGETVGREWQVLTEPCPTHGGGSLVDNEALYSASTDLLRYEITVPQRPQHSEAPL